MRRALSSTVLGLALVGAFGVGACQGCHTQQAVGPADATVSDKPTVRLFVLSTVAGSLEPCGCTKDQLGGMDHLAAFVEKERTAASSSLVLSAGPLLFSDPVLKDDIATQYKWKADAIAQSAKEMRLAAWTPGANDFAAGAAQFDAYRKEVGAPVLVANVEGVPGGISSTIVEAEGTKIGILGVSNPTSPLAPAPEGLRIAPAGPAMKATLDDLRAKGAKVFVALAALPRGEALRIVDELPGLHVLVIGKPSERGEGNDAPKAPVLLGNTLVVEGANHMQTVGVVDLYVRSSAGPIVFADGGGVAKAEQLLTLSSRIRDLENRINSWERDRTVDAKDLGDRKADLERLRAEKSGLETGGKPPAGSFFNYRSVEVRGEFGADAAVHARMLAYYKRVNEHNKTEFADRKPPPVEPGKAEYIGVDACTDCHDEERKVWDGTLHAHAYATLEKDFKEFNLDCVSCHVTGYGKPAGSTVTHVAKLKNVGCEECHGPGSLHAKKPEDKTRIILKPEPDSCVSQCHHPPHVEGFDAKEKIKLVLGPGHGQE